MFGTKNISGLYSRRILIHVSNGHNSWLYCILTLFCLQTTFPWCLEAADVRQEGDGQAGFPAQDRGDGAGHFIWSTVQGPWL